MVVLPPDQVGIGSLWVGNLRCCRAWRVA